MKFKCLFLLFFCSEAAITQAEYDGACVFLIDYYNNLKTMKNVLVKTPFNFEELREPFCNLQCAASKKHIMKILGNPDLWHWKAGFHFKSDDNQYEYDLRMFREESFDAIERFGRSVIFDNVHASICVVYNWLEHLFALASAGLYDPCEQLVVFIIINNQTLVSSFVELNAANVHILSNELIKIQVLKTNFAEDLVSVLDQFFNLSDKSKQNTKCNIEFLNEQETFFSKLKANIITCLLEELEMFANQPLAEIDDVDIKLQVVERCLKANYFGTKSENLNVLYANYTEYIKNGHGLYSFYEFAQQHKKFDIVSWRAFILTRFQEKYMKEKH